MFVLRIEELPVFFVYNLFLCLVETIKLLSKYLSTSVIATCLYSTYAAPFCFPFSSFSTASSIFLKLQLLQKLG